MDQAEKKYCYNCKYPLDDYNTFCPKCGQRYRTSRKSLSTFISDFLKVNLNLDNKLIKTIVGLLRPGFLTKQYFAGVQKTYTLPLQFFFGIALIFFTILSFRVGNIDSGASRLEKQTRRQAQVESMVTFRDSIKSDSLLGLQEIQKERIDSIFEISKEKSLPKGGHTMTLIWSEFRIEDDTMFLDERGFPLSVLLNQTPDDFVNENFKEDNFLVRQFYKQMLKLALSGGSYIQYLIKQSPIYIVISLPFLALLFQLLYWRRKFYFVEHLVFFLHLLCFCFLVFLPSVIFNWVESGLLNSILLLVVMIYGLLGMKYFYGQGWGKTIFKYFLALFFGIFAITFALVLVLLISIMLF